MQWDLHWLGGALESRMRSAAQEATRETLDAAVETAKSMAPVLTGQYQSSIRVMDADESGDIVSGSFGSDVRYAFYIEVGARGKPPQSVLRRAADIEFGQHADRINGRV